MNAKKILNEHKDLFLWLVVICWISLISIFWNTEWFRASILQIPEKFDWAVYPIEKVPNWFTWGWNNKTTKFSEIAKKDLVDIPKYSMAVWWKTPAEIKENNAEKEAKLTYPIVYMWNYDVEDRTEWKWSHLAVDIRVPIWTPVVAIANATVVKAITSNSWFWNHIVLEIKNAPEFWNSNRKTDYYVNYCHLSEVDVKPGQIVKRWQMIWKTWESWTATTPHLHFQIDKKTAPWHPYWPFTAKEAYWANLNFFSAVSAWLWKENAIKYTINPLKWIDQNLNNNLSNLNKVAWKKVKTEKKVEDKIVKFDISWKSEFTTDKNIELQITAKDWNNKVILDFKPSSDIQISSTSNTAKFSKILKFENWIAKIEITDPQAENFSFEIKTKDNKFTKKITSKEAEKTVAIKKDTQNIVKENKEVAVLNSDSTVKTNEEKTTTWETLHWTSETKITKEKENIDKKNNEEPAVKPDTNKTSNLDSSTKASEWQSEKKVKTNKENEKTVTQEVKKEVKQVKKNKEENLHKSAPEVKENAFTDVTPENKNYEAIKYLKDNWVISWYKDWSFKPTKTVSRVEAVKMIFAWLKIWTENAKNLAFSDTTNDAWYSPFVWAALKKWIVKWYSDWSFKPSKSVNRSEYYKILLLSAEINPSVPMANPYSDVDKNSWFAPYIWFVKDANLVKVNWENFFPAEWVSRAEVAESLYNLIKFLGK